MGDSLIYFIGNCSKRGGKMDAEKIKELRKKAMALPLSPGVYIMLDKKGKIIYIGKAKALKNRVSQYFGSQNNHAEKVRRMVENVDDFKYIICDSEFEALILECSLIKQNVPKYNILLKDDKGYSYVRVSDEKWRKITYELQKKDDGATYIGPYKNSFYVKHSVDEANRIFRLPTCNRKFPRDFGKGRPCLNFHINQCVAPCTGKVKFSDYDKNVEEALDFLKGGSSASIKKLTEEMEKASENLEFERAATIRDKINAVKKMAEKQKVVSVNVPDQHIIAYFTDGEKGCFQVFVFKGGQLVDHDNFIVKNPVNDEEEMSQFITGYYSLEHEIPKNLTLDRLPEDKDLLERWLSEKRGSRVYITCPQRGEQAQLVQLCKKNASEVIAQMKGRTSKEYSVLEELKTLLGLSKIPEYIESYDISNLSGTENVAGMIVYENGKPLKSAYKKFKIKSIEGQDDYGSMAEVIERRFIEYGYLKNTGTGFGRMPDLILLDGGKGQVAAVQAVLDRMGISVPLFGMVKDGSHRTRAITGAGGEVSINSRRSVFTFISKMQDEVHRFAIGYHHQRRKNTTFKSSLTEIPGIGEVRAKALLKHFRTIANIKNADLFELESCPKMNHDSAVAVFNYFHNNK